MKYRWLALVLAAMLVGLLSACGGGGNPQPPDNLFTKDNAWTEPVPSSATKISEDEFRQMVGSGELELRSTADVKAQAAARDQQFKDDKAFLSSIPNPSPDIKALLEAAKSYDSYQGDVPVKMPAGNTVVLNGLGTQLRNAAESYKLSQSTDNALAVYTQSYNLLPDDLKAKAPTPDSLKGKSLADIQAALKQLNDLLAGESNLDKVRLEPTAIAPASSLPASGLSPQATIRPGQGSDHDSYCPAPTGLAARYWFPLKNFVSPIKDQAARGTCWAFAAIGAVESREQVQDDLTVNLSEQFLVNKVKQDWDPNDYADGYWSDAALNEAVDRGQALPSEAGWTYNPAWNRPYVKDGDAGSYAKTCDPYGGGPNGGSCSDTAHESPMYCTTVIFVTYCGYYTVVFSGSGTQASRAHQLWANGQPFYLGVYRLYLALGHVLIANFPVYRGFMNDVGNDGVVSNYAKTYFKEVKDKDGKVIGTKEVPGSYGGHAVQIVGFLSNEELSTPSYTSKVGGGGYFIIKNSWGCGAGDGGYYYVPADYVSSLFGSLYALDFGGARSARWTHEQQYPGSSDAPKITIKAKPATIDLRVQADLANFFGISHPVAKSVTLTVQSNRDGTIYSGSWNTDPYSFGGRTAPYTFTTTGTRTLTLTASYGGKQSSASFNVNVVNSPPTLTLEASGDAQQGVPYSITAQEYDKNEASSATLCANTTWSVDAPDTLSSTTGCQVEVTFGETGTRTVSATTHDTEGLTATDTLTLDVQPPPVNPYPIITSAGVDSREFYTSSGGFLLCGSVSVPSGDTIDFDEDGCSIIIDNPPPDRYFAQVEVENPDKETLTYDWTVYITRNGSESVLEQSPGSSSPVFDPYSVGNAIPVTDACRITVTVNAPDPTRSKSLTVWAGLCTYYSTYIG